MKIDFNFLRDILSTPSYFQQEAELKNLILSKYENQTHIDVKLDAKGNLYLTKGIADFYPCFVAHMDTVHQKETINIREEIIQQCDQEFTKWYAINNQGFKTGIGGDDKAGVFEALTVFNALDVCKVALFVEEERGCLGSKLLDKEFFKNVGYCIQFDGPEDFMVTQVCVDQVLFKQDSDFGKIVTKIIPAICGEKIRYFVHPYTDIWQIKALTDLCCINVPAGYFNMHSTSEFVILEIVAKSCELGLALAEGLGQKQYIYKAEDSAKDYNNSGFGSWQESLTPLI